MSFSTITNRWLNRFYKSIAVLLVLFAVLISALRLLLPYAHNYRQDFQDYLNQTYQSKITIGILTMDWQKLGPALVAKNVNLVNTDGIEVFIESIDIRVDFWRSLRARQLITQDFTLVGAKVFLSTKLIGDDKLSAEDQQRLNHVVDLFLNQFRRFSLRDSQLILQTGQNQSTFLISQLEWLNKGDRHQAKGDIVVDGVTANNLKLQLDIQGSGLGDMSGQVYVEANQLNITPWLDTLLAIDNDKTNSDINFSAWLTINQGKAQQVQLVLGQNQINWQHKSQSHELGISEGQFALKDIHGFDHFNLYSTALTLILDQQSWQPTHIMLQQKPENLSAYVSYFDIAGVNSLVPLFYQDEKLSNLLSTLAPIGDLGQIYFNKSLTATSQQAKLQLVANFDHYGNQFSHGIPGIKNVSGQILLDNQQVQVSFKALKAQLDFAQHFLRPIPYDQLSATLNANFTDQGWQINSDDFSLSSNELSLSADIKLVQPKHGETELALLTLVQDLDTANIHFYYPHLLMGENLVNYLNAGLIEGQIDQAQVLFNGPLSHFPFDDNSGILTVDASLSQAKFEFSPQWPAITDFAANLNFTNNSMLITGRSGQLSGIDVTGVEAAIAELTGEQILAVDVALAATQPAVIADLIQLSPLKSSVGATLKQIVISKPVTGHYSLMLPLQNPTASVSKGWVNFSDNDIALQSPRMDLFGVNGQLTFNNDVIKVDKLAANLFSLPLVLNINAGNKARYYATDIHFDANWQDQRWLKHVPEQLKKYGQGALDWQGDLSLYMHHDGGFSYDLAIDSGLTDIQLDLPAPFALSAGQNMPLVIKASGQVEQSTINAQLGSQLSFYGVLEHQKQQFSRAHLVLGDETMLLPMDGFHITTKLAQADFDQWQPLIADIINTVTNHQVASSGATVKTPLVLKPERIRGTVNELTLAGQTLNDVSFNLLDKQQWWLLQLNAKQARTRIKLYSDWLGQGVEVNADFLHLSSSGGDSEHAVAVLDSAAELARQNALFANIPPMRVHCESCSLDKLDFGEVNFSIEKSQQDIVKLKRFTAQRGKTKLSLEGQWQHNNQGSKTQIHGDFNAKNVEDELEKLGFASIVKDSGIRLNFKNHWQGGPQDFSLSRLNGDVSTHLDDGYLAEVDDTLRVLSVLSLQSLVRKLKLDFRDIFVNGMLYSKIDGDFRLRDGILYTDNTKMKGAAGDLSIKGNTQMSEGILDYRMSYKPNLTASLPALAWIVGLNPALVIAGFAFDQVVTSKVISEFDFELTGNIEQPNLRQVKRKTQYMSVGRSTPPQIVENTPQSKPVTDMPLKKLSPAVLKRDKNNSVEDVDG